MATYAHGQAIAAAWVLSLAVDFLLHGGVLARLYATPSPFLLPPMEAFRRIPAGYIAFLILTIALAWIMRRVGIRGLRSGFIFGIAAGAAVWGALVLGLWSISTAAPALLVGWLAGQTIELGVAGALIGSAAAGARPRRLWTVTVAVLLACVTLTVLLQSIGWAPALKDATG